MLLILTEMGHPQPPTPIHCDNTTSVGITNNTAKKHHSRSMEMRYFYIVDQVGRQIRLVQYHPGLEILGDFASKHHVTSHHVNGRPTYLHMEGSPEFLPRAPKPSDMRDERLCWKKADGYKRGHPLPDTIPRIRSRFPCGTTGIACVCGVSCQ